MVSAINCRRALVDESEMIITQMRTHKRSEIVRGTTCVIVPRSSNNNYSYYKYQHDLELNKMYVTNHR
jgi:hypothetical protein